MPLASLAQLERSHRRHDEVMATLLEAARRLAAGRPQVRDLDDVRDAVGYFERSVRRHFLDEEGSLFPRLSTRRPELAAQLAALSAEHPTQVDMQQRVARAASALAPASRPGAGKELLDAAVALAELHQAHVGREDALFALAEQALTSEDDDEIVAEMATRRDREDESGGPRRGTGGGGGGGGGRGRSRGRGATAAGARVKLARKPAKKTAAKSAAKTSRKKPRPTTKRTASKRKRSRR